MMWINTLTIILWKIHLSIERAWFLWDKSFWMFVAKRIILFCLIQSSRKIWRDLNSIERKKNIKYSKNVWVNKSTIKRAQSWEIDKDLFQYRKVKLMQILMTFRSRCLKLNWIFTFFATNKIKCIHAQTTLKKSKIDLTKVIVWNKLARVNTINDLKLRKNWSKIW